MTVNGLMKWVMVTGVLVASCVGNAWADRHGHGRTSVGVEWWARRAALLSATTLLLPALCAGDH